MTNKCALKYAIGSLDFTYESLTALQNDDPLKVTLKEVILTLQYLLKDITDEESNDK